MSSWVIGVDVGGTKTEASLFDDGIAVATTTLPTVPGPSGVVATCMSAVRSILQSKEASAAAVGVGLPGEVDSSNGTVRHAVNLGFGGEPFPMAQVLSERLSIPVTIENDVRAGAVGVYQWLRSTADIHSAAYLALGTGVSAGLVNDGRLLRGQRGMAGEIGHVVIDADGPPCRCGARGCLESVLGGWALGPAWRHGASAVDVFRAAEADNESAADIADRAGLYLAHAIQWLMAAYDPDRVVVGGGLMDSSQHLMGRARQYLRRWSARSDVVAAALDTARVLTLPEGLAPGPRGAAFLTGAIGPRNLVNHHMEGDRIP